MLGRLIDKNCGRKLAMASVIGTFLFGCVSTGVVLTRVEPPKSPAAAALKRVAVLPFEGPYGAEITPQFESVLTQAGVNGELYYQVVDRRTLDNAIHELNMKYTGLMDPRNAARLGRFLNIDAIYTGTIIVPPIQSQTYTEPRTECTAVKDPNKLISKCTSTRNYTVNCTRKMAQFSMLPRLVKVETAQIVYQPTLTASREGASCQDSSPGDGEGQLLGMAATEVFQKLKEDLTPHVVSESLKLKTNTEGLPPASVEQFNGAYAFAKADRMDRACEIWNRMADAGTNSLAIMYNSAACNEYSGNIDQALAAYKRIDASLTAPDADVNTAIRRMNERIETRRRSGAGGRILQNAS
jgi:hypothetical protein